MTAATATIRPRVTGELKEQLYGAFATGEAESKEQRQDLAERFGLMPTTVDYHYRVWVKAGRPGQVEVVGPVAEDAAEDSPLAEIVPAHVDEAQDGEADTEAADQPPQEAAPKKGVGEQADSASEGTERQDETEEKQAEPVEELPTAMAEALRKAGLATATETVARRSAPDAPSGLPEVGSVYEGVVVRVDDRYVLVRLADLQDHRGRRPIGKVSIGETSDRWLTSCFDLGWREGDLVNVKVLSVNWDRVRDKIYISLSVRQAPPHPHGPTRATAHAPAQSEPEPIVARGADVVVEDPLYEADRHNATRLAQELIRKHRLAWCHLGDLADQIMANGIARTAEELDADLSSMAALKAAGQSKVDDPQVIGPAGLCTPCVHRLDGFCPYAEYLMPTYQIPDDELPERHRGRRIVFGPRQVVECDLHRPVMTR